MIYIIYHLLPFLPRPPWWRHPIDKPNIINFFKFFGDLFTGNWGKSISIARDVEVYYLIKDRAPITIDLLLLPIMLGIGNYIVFGIMLGRTSTKYEGKRKGKVIQILYNFGIAIPIFFFGMMLQYLLSIKLDWFPATGYKDPSYQDPEFVTGLYIIDALLAGETKKIFDYLYHLTLPLFIITLTSTSLIALQTRSYLKDKSHKKSIISNTAITGTTFGFIFMFIILIENTFGLCGIGRLFIDAINQLDYWVINVILFIILIMFVIITLISNLIFSLYKFLVNKFRFDSTLNDKAKKETENNEIRSKEIITENLNLKEYLLKKVKSPLFIIAAILVIFFISIAIFPNWLTPYSLEEVTGYYTGSWSPPSSDHPLGTASFGRDILGLTIWGIRDALIFGFGAVVIGLIGCSIFGFITRISFFIRPRVKHPVALVFYDGLIYSVVIGFIIAFFMYLFFGLTAILIGLIGGLIFGFIIGILSFIISRVKRSDEPINFQKLVHSVILSSMIIFSIFPGIIFVLLSTRILRDFQISEYLFPHIYSSTFYYWVTLSGIGIILIPIFTRAISNTISGELNLNKIGKTIIIHIPLCFTIAIIFFEVLGYLGWLSYEIGEINLGEQISIARLRFHTSPLAIFSPGIALTWLLMSFLLLHIALQDNELDISKRVPIS